MRLIIFLVSILSSSFLSCVAQTTPHAAAVLPADSISNTATGHIVTAPGNSALVIYQAANGDYWFGGDGEGVYRYDGKTTIHYPKQGGLAGQIREIREDKKGNIFFSTQETGICKFDGQRFIALGTLLNASANKDWALSPDDLWFRGETNKNGPYRINGTSLYSLQFPKHYLEDEYYARFPGKAWSPYEVYSVYQDTKGNVWLGTGNFGICRFDGRSLSWLYEDHLTNIEGGGSFGIRSMIEDKEGKFWFCNTQYRYTIIPNTDPKRYRKKKGNNLVEYRREKGIEGIKAANGADFVYFMSATKDNQGDLWLASSREGVWRYDGKKVIHYPVGDGLKDIRVYSIYNDRKGVLWLGTLNDGPFSFNGNAFQKFRP